MFCTRGQCKKFLIQTLRTQRNQSNGNSHHRPRGACSRSHSSSSFQRPEVKKEWRIHPMTSIPVVCFILGWWQIERRKAKLQLIADIESRYLLEPVPFDSDQEYPEYTPVCITGEYDYSKEFYLGPRHEIVDYRDKGEPGGYHSIVPMLLESGERILVDRGFVSTRTDTPIGQVTGSVTQVGYIRHAEGAVFASLAPAVGTSQTYIWRDSQMMAKCAGTLPVTVELISQHTIPGGPIAGQTRLSVYNKHVEYVITWWGMGIASLFFIFRFRRKPKSIPSVFK